MSSRAPSETHPGAREAISSAERSLVLATNAFLDTLDQPWSLERMAEIAGLSVFHFARCFKAHFDETPAEHIRRVRLERAAVMLLNWPTGSALDIALACGFNSGAAFSRAFGAHFGMPPRVWRGRKYWRLCEKSALWCWRPPEACATCASVEGPWAAHRKQTGLMQNLWRLERPAGIESIEIVERAPIHVAYLRHIGPLDEVAIPAWQGLQRHLASQQLLHPDLQCLSTGLGYLDITPPDRFRYDLGYVCRPLNRLDPAFHYREIPGGLFASARIRCKWSEVTEVEFYLWCSWLAQSEFRFRPGQGYGTVSLKDYEDVTALDIGPDTQVVWQMHVPVAPRKRISKP